VLLLVAGGIAVAAPSAGVADSGSDALALQSDANGTAGSDGPDGPTDPAEDNGTADGVSLGTRISSFMQASSAEADGSVDAGMWAAEFNASNGTGRTVAVENRIATLERRLDRLESRVAALVAEARNGTGSDVAFLARAARLTEEIDSVESAIDDADAAAERVGADATRLDRLREEVRNVSDHEVPQAARNVLRGGPPERGDRGPPPEAGPPDDAGPPETPPGNEGDDDDERDDSDSPDLPDDADAPDSLDRQDDADDGERESGDAD
jgi:hypothetical protein